jgi:hypothetical protein
VGACFQIRPDGAKADRIVHLFRSGQIGAAELATTNGNAWGLLNAATQHIDHEVGCSADSRVKSAWFGHREAVKRRLLARLLHLCSGAAG